MRLALTGLAVALTGCGQTQNMATSENLSVTDAAAPATPAAGPQIAYTYSFSYRLDGDDIAPVQARHLALCRALGPTRCVVIKTELNRGDGDAPTAASTAMVVDARLAPAFGARLDAAVAGAGGEVASRRTAAEDVTKQVVDTDARVRAKQALADRLLLLIRTSNGRVGDLVAAEKAYADTQEQLDAARGLQASLRRRVAMSEVAIDYQSTAATGRWAPVGQAVRDAGSTLAGSLAGLLTFLVAALPWALALAALLWIARRRGWRLRRRRPAPPPA